MGSLDLFITMSTLTTSRTSSGQQVSAQVLTQHTLKALYDTLDGYADRLTLRFAAPAALLGGLATWLLNWGRDPISFADDAYGFGVLIFFFSILTAFVCSSAGFILGVRFRNSLVPAELRRAWVWSVLPLAFAYAVVVGLFAAIGLQFAGMVFPELALQSVYAIVLVGLICGVVANSVANQCMQLRVRNVLGLFIVTLLGGVAISAITVNNAMWWEKSFSFLGESESRSRIIFNTTLIVSGILLIILQQFFMDDFVYLRHLGVLTARKVRWGRAGLVGLGVLMAMIGIIPFGINGYLNTVHDLCAYSIAGILLAFMLTTRRFLPGLMPEFYAVTWVTVVLLITAVALHLLGSINTVGVELLAFAIGGAWFILFIKHVELFVEHLNPGAATAAPSGATDGVAAPTARPMSR